MATKNPKQVTIYGRLSFPVFSYAEAVARNPKSKFPKKPDEITPEFNLLVEDAQLAKLIDHVKGEFLPNCLQRSIDGEKKDALTKAEVAKIVKALDAADWETQPPYLSIKAVNAKTQVLVPEAVASIKINGNRGVDIEQKAIVNNEQELVVPDPDILQFPVIKPISATVHQMYPGAYVAATLNLYAYISGALPGFSASASVAVFKADADRLGGGTAIDEDEIFAD